MNRDLAEALLRRVLSWDDDEINRELPPLHALAQYKYDDYRRYEPGDRFLERLALWLEQFADADRPTAFDYLKRRLIFVSEAETRQLIRMAFPHIIVPLVRRQVALTTGLPLYRVTALEQSDEFQVTLRRSLFLGLSDGARLDELRRSARSLSHEQVYLAYELADERAEDMQSSLSADLARLSSTQDARFRLVFLVDDFAGSGTSLLRFENGVAKGRLARFAKWMRDSPLFDESAQVFILLYVATEQALTHLESALTSYGDAPWKTLPEVVPILRLGPNTRMACPDDPFDPLLHSKYDGPALMNSHRGVGGASMVHGYGDCGLSLVLAHNTPNNSVYILWESQTGLYVPLFPRVDRHTEK